MQGPLIKDDFTQSSSTDIKKFISKMISGWYLFLIAFIIIIGFVVLFNLYSTPTYSATTTLLIRDDTKQTLGAESLIQNFSFKMTDNIQNEIGILKSYSLTKRTLKELHFDVSYYKQIRWASNISLPFLKRNLYKESPIIVIPDSGAVQTYNKYFKVRILSRKDFRLIFNAKLPNNQKVEIDEVFLFGQPIKSSFFNFTIKLSDKYSPDFDTETSDLYTYDYFFKLNNLDELTNYYEEALHISFLYKDASILELKLKGEHPQKICDYLNKLTDTYLLAELELKNQIANSTIEFIDRQISGISDSLKTAENNFQQFRSSHNIINISAEGNYTMQKMEDLVKEKSKYERMAQYYDYLFDYIEGKNDFKDVIVPSTMGIEDAMLNSLVTRLSDLHAKRALVLLSVREKSPQIKQLNKEIENTRNALLENVRNIVKSTRIAIAGLDKQIAQVEQEMKMLPKTERELINYKRSFTLNDQIYTFLLQKRSEAGIALASNVSDHRVLDRAEPANTLQVSPNKKLNFFIGILLSFLLPVAFISMRDFFNTKITDQYSIEDHTSIPIIGYVTHQKNNKKGTVYDNPKSSLAEAFRAIRTNLQFLLVDHDDIPVIGVTSSIAGEGKTFCSTNIAAIISMSNKRTLVVGMDLRKPQTHTHFEISNAKGLSNYLIHDATFEEIVMPTSIPKLYITPAGPIPPNPSELLETERMQSFFDEAKKHFDVIILDTPPVALVTDAIIISKYTDTMIFVVRHNYSDKHAIQFINTLYEQKKLKNLSILVNDIRIPHYVANYNYGYGYGYKNGSGYYEE
ncbi:MAG: polysaccharide biosynthesis tyrosine autokinase [Chlorobi bacterium]|nr:polysaccharide biosynthesis tyrosine autokinase [Chlorobiota bacterium]